MFPTEFSPTTKDQNLIPTAAGTANTEPDSPPKSIGRWTKEEHQRFVEGLRKFGKNWKKIEEFVGTRSGPQIRSHAQKFFIRLEREVGAEGKNPQGLLELDDTPERIRKVSNCSNSTSFSNQESLLDQTRDLQKRLELKQKLEASLSISALLDSFPLQLYTPTLNSLYGLNNFESKPRRMSLDNFPMQQNTSNTLLEALMPPKARPMGTNLDINQLSNLIKLTSNPHFSLLNHQPLQLNLEQIITLNHSINLNNTINNNISIHNNNNHTASMLAKPRKFSEDHVLLHNNLTPVLTQTPQNRLAEFEILAKKLKRY